MSSNIYNRFLRKLDLKSLREAILRTHVSGSSNDAPPSILNEDEGPMSAFLATRRDPIKMLDLLGFRKTEEATNQTRTGSAGQKEDGELPAKPPFPIPSIIAERIARIARRGR
ncbi:hypothetical protein [Ochrobactrum sp. RH2CCR150]|uniref:hypothetical protein n=1 Tax=Ochrobactrum sp. RH2CCR150 TaxID=2587044 RepID=UPI0015F9098B|nr:hypothetical protein [Ochrobactrum sp. RH2CCR150]